MYIAVVTATMLLLPALSIAIDMRLSAAAISISLIGKWFVFWAVGVRLLLAGSRQIAQPRYTAQVILGLKSEESLLLVRELGFANSAIGAIAATSLFLPSWLSSAALAGGIFYGFAGLNHALQRHRGRLQIVAMVSDLFAAAVLFAIIFGAIH